MCTLSQVNAQDIIGYFAGQPDSFSEYAVYVGEKKRLNLGFSYIQTRVVSTKATEKGKIVTTEHKILNKKKKFPNSSRPWEWAKVFLCLLQLTKKEAII